MEALKGDLKTLFEYFSRRFLEKYSPPLASSSLVNPDEDDEFTTTGSSSSSTTVIGSSASSEELKFIVKCLNSLKSQFTSINDTDRQYLTPIMALSAQVIICDAQLVPRHSLSDVKEALLYAMQFMLKDLALYTEDTPSSSSPAAGQSDDDFLAESVHKFSTPGDLAVESNEFYQYFLKYCISKFVIFLLDTNGSSTGIFLLPSDLEFLAEMLVKKTFPESLWIQVQAVSDSNDSQKSSKKSSHFSSAGSLPGLGSNRARMSSDISGRDENSAMTTAQNFFNQLNTPVTLGDGDAMMAIEGDKNLADFGANQVRAALINHIQMHFRIANRANIFLKLITRYTSLRPFILKLVAIESGHASLEFVKHSVNLESLCNLVLRDLDLALSIFELGSLLEPLSLDRISKLINITLAAQYASCNLLSDFLNCENEKKDDIQNVIPEIICKTLQINEGLFSLLEVSNRVTGLWCHNIHMAMVWLLSGCIQLILKQNPSRDQSLNQFEVCTHFFYPFLQLKLKMLSSLVHDLNVEFGDTRNDDDFDESITSQELDKFVFSLPPSSSSQEAVPSFTFAYDKFGLYSAWEKVNMLFSSNVNIFELLFSLMFNSYERVKGIFNSSIEITEDGSSSFSLAILFGNEDASDREPLRNVDNYYELVIDVINHLNNNYVYSKIVAVREYFQNMLTPEIIGRLVAIVQDLDVATVYRASFSFSFAKFATSFNLFMFNMIRMNVFNEEQLDMFLGKLKLVSTIAADGTVLSSPSLYYGNSSLGILAHIVLLRHQNEKTKWANGIMDTNIITLKIWRERIELLKNAILMSDHPTSANNDEFLHFQSDMNVEHAQLLVFLFQDIDLPFRKEIFSMVISALYDVGKSFSSQPYVSTELTSSQILLLGRLLHFFEYMCKNMYLAPSFLFEQVNNNLLSWEVDLTKSVINAESILECFDKDSMKIFNDFRHSQFFTDSVLDYILLKTIFFDNPELLTTEIYHNFVVESILHPKFYHLFDIDTVYKRKGSGVNKRCAPDSVASNMVYQFSKVPVEKFYKSLMTIFDTINAQYDITISKESGKSPRFGWFGNATIDYTFQTVWRLIHQIHPPLSMFTDIRRLIENSDSLQSGPIYIQPAYLINLCIWLERLDDPYYLLTFLFDFEASQEAGDAIKAKLIEIRDSFKSLPLNAALLKAMAIQMFRFNPEAVLEETNFDFITQEQKALRHFGVPKLFELFAIDRLLQRVMSVFDQYVPSDEKSKTDSSTKFAEVLSDDSKQFLFNNMFVTSLSMFRKIYDDINILLCYNAAGDVQGGPGCVPENNLPFFLSRAVMNVAGYDKFQMSRIANSVHMSDLFDRINTFNGLYVNFNRVTQSPDSSFQVMIIEEDRQMPFLNFYLAHESMVTASQMTALNTIPCMGSCNVTWIKLRQFWNRLYKFSVKLSEASGGPLNQQQHCALNKCSIGTSLIARQIYENNLQENFEELDSGKSESAIFYLKNAFFILSIAKNADQNEQMFDLPLLTIHSMFSRILLPSIALGFNVCTVLEEFLCESTPTTPTGDSSGSVESSNWFVNLIEIAANVSRREFAFNLMVFFNSFYEKAYQNQKGSSLKNIAETISSQLAERKDLDSLFLNWFTKVLSGNEEVNVDSDEIYFTFSQFVNFACKPSSQLDEKVFFSLTRVVRTLCDRFLARQLSDNYLQFPILFSTLVKLASAVGNTDKNLVEGDDESSTGHLLLIESVQMWLIQLKNYLKNKDVMKKIVDHAKHGRHRSVIESIHQMISYLADITNAFEFKYLFSKQKNYVPLVAFASDEKMIDDDEVVKINVTQVENDPINDKLCTFTTTQKNFQQQHWYQCHTCGFVESQGVCNICAQVCHSGHDVVYSKYGQFFCDCGETRESCKALFKRQPVARTRLVKMSPAQGIDRMVKNFDRISKYWYSSTYNNDVRHRYADNHRANKFANPKINEGYAQFGLKFSDSAVVIKNLLALLNGLADTVHDFVEFFVPVLENYFKNESELSFLPRLKEQFEQLTTQQWNIVETSQLMKHNGSTQESLFEMSMRSRDFRGYSPQYLAVMNNSKIAGKPSYCFVAHERHRISVVDLDLLSGQICQNAHRNRILLKRQPTIQCSFSVFILAMNPLNNRLLVASGTSECDVFHLNDDATVIEHVHLQQGGTERIMKTLWIPKSQTELCLVYTHEIVIFDVSPHNKTNQPTYRLLLVHLQLTDVTFFTHEEDDGTLRRFIIIATEDGEIRFQELNYECSMANPDVKVHGGFQAFSSTLWELPYQDFDVPSKYRERNFTQLYYSHALHTLFMSVGNGQAYAFQIEFESLLACDLQDPFLITECAVLAENNEPVNESIVQNPIITFEKDFFYGWQELASHPGMVFAMNAFEPVVFFFTADTVNFQMLKGRKIFFSSLPFVFNTDATKSVQTTALLSLSLAGALSIHETLPEHTNYWSSSNSVSFDSIVRVEMPPSAAPSIGENKFEASVDFFEKLTIIDSDVEFSSEELEDIYNSDLIKSRLNSQDQYIACQSPSGFSLTVKKIRGDHHIAGIRVHLGSDNIQNSPSMIEVFGRVINTEPVSPRWYDIPFSDEEIETIARTNTFTVSFGPSNSQVTWLHRFKVYGTPMRMPPSSSSASSNDTHLAASSSSNERKVLRNSTPKRAIRTHSNSNCQAGNNPTEFKFPHSLYAPCITEDKSNNNFKGLFVIYRFLSNVVDSLEGLISFTHYDAFAFSDEDAAQLQVTLKEIAAHQSDAAYKQIEDRIMASAKILLEVSLCNTFDQRLCMLLAKLCKTRNKYDLYRDLVILGARFKTLDNCDSHTFAHNIAVFRQIAAERPMNFVMAVLEKEGHSSSDVTVDTVNNVLTQFHQNLNVQFFKYQLGNSSRLMFGTCVEQFNQLADLDQIVENLVSIHFSMLVGVASFMSTNCETSFFESRNQRLMETTTALVRSLLISDNILVNIAAKNALTSLVMNNFEDKTAQKPARPNVGGSSSGQGPNDGGNSRPHQEEEESVFVPPERSLRRHQSFLNNLLDSGRPSGSGSIGQHMRSISNQQDDHAGGLVRQRPNGNLLGQSRHTRRIVRLMQGLLSNSNSIIRMPDGDFSNYLDYNNAYPQLFEDEEDDDLPDLVDEYNQGIEEENEGDEEEEENIDDIDDDIAHHMQDLLDGVVAQHIVADDDDNEMPPLEPYPSNSNLPDIPPLSSSLNARADIPHIPLVDESDEEYIFRNVSDDDDTFASMDSFQSPRSDGSSIRRTTSESNQSEMRNLSLNVSGSSTTTFTAKSSCGQLAAKRLRKTVLSKFVLSILSDMNGNLRELQKHDGTRPIPFLQVLYLLMDYKFQECDRKDFGRVYSNLCTKLIEWAIERAKNITNEEHSNELFFLILRLLDQFIHKFKQHPNLRLSAMNNDALDILKATMNATNISFGTVLGNRKDYQDPPPNLSPSSYSACLIGAHLINASESLFFMCHQSLKELLKNFWKNSDYFFSKTPSETTSNVNGQPVRSKAGDSITFQKLKDVPNSTVNISEFKPFIGVDSTGAGGDNSAAQGSASTEVAPAWVFENDHNQFERLTEVFLNLTMSLKKLIHNAEVSGDLKFFTTSSSNTGLIDLLLDFMTTEAFLANPIRRIARKLLAFLCGSKEEYRKIKDYYTFKLHFRRIKKHLVNHMFMSNSDFNSLRLEQFGLSANDLENDDNLNQLLDSVVGEIVARALSSNNKININSSVQFVMSHMKILKLSYSDLNNLHSELKLTFDLASSHVENWRELCKEDSSILPFLVRISFLFEEKFARIIIDLINRAIQDSSPLFKDICSMLSKKMFQSLDSSTITMFVRTFLMETNSQEVRWSTHSLFKVIFESIGQRQREELANIFWRLWADAPFYGKRASQFVDLLGYFSINVSQGGTSEETEKLYADLSMALLKHLNQILTKHPNWSIYNSLQNYLDFNGHYLETDPCAVCNSPETNAQTFKLSQIKVDIRYTASQMFIKLNASYAIQKITIKLSDLKKTKQAKVFEVFYNNKVIENSADLKNLTLHWEKGNSVTLTPNQNEIRIDFGLPIVACNLMFKFADFYETLRSSDDTVQCPRCSAMVSASPGMCDNCGENVFQCHKCRTINYNDHDPYLCQNCGYCMYAKFDYTFVAKHTPNAVDPLENEADRAKAVETVNSLMSKADMIYHQIVEVRSDLEKLLLVSQGCQNTVYCDNIPTTSAPRPISTTAAATPANTMNVHIRRIADRYNNDCKSYFEEFSKILQTVLVNRKEIVDYDNLQHFKRQDSIELKNQILQRFKNQLSAPESRTELFKDVDSVQFNCPQCFGCCTAAVMHCIILLRALAGRPKFKPHLSSLELFRELIEYNLRFGSVEEREEVRVLLCLLICSNEKSTEDFNGLILKRVEVAFSCKFVNSNDFEPIRNEIALFALTFKNEDFLWESRFRCCMSLLLLSLQNSTPIVLESCTLPCLKILTNLIEKPKGDKHSIVEPTVPQRQIEANERFIVAQISIDLSRFLANDSKHSFINWQERNKFIARVDSQSEEYPAYHQQLERKYFSKWRFFVKKTPDQQTIRLESDNWIKKLLFNPTSKSLRLTAKNLLRVIFERGGNNQKIIIDLLTSFFADLGEQRGEVALEYLQLFKAIIFPEWDSKAAKPQTKPGEGYHWRFYLVVVKHLLDKLLSLISFEIERLKLLESECLSSSISQGFILQQLIELLQMFLVQENICKVHQWGVIKSVLEGYLNLRILVVQRTKMVDEAEMAMVNLLDLLVGTSKSNRVTFLNLCVEATRKCAPDDFRMPNFLIERICSLIYTDEKVTDEFYITIEKDPAQEDFLSGRMQGNPYSSYDAAMGPQMRDIKNKICRECELTTFLHDDSGLELLVNGKIISLDMPVKDVYTQVVMHDWRQRQSSNRQNAAGPGGGVVAGSSQNAERRADATEDLSVRLLRNLNIFNIVQQRINQALVSNNVLNILQNAPGTSSATRAKLANSGPTMKIVYRIRGFNGEATEEFIEPGSESEQVNNDEEVYEMAGHLDSEGFEMLLHRLNCIEELTNSVRQLLTTALKLFNIALKLQKNRLAMTNPKLNAIGALLRILRLVLKGLPFEALSTPTSVPHLEEVLDLMDIILAEASKKSADEWDEFNRLTCGSCQDIRMLVSYFHTEEYPFENRTLPMPFVTKVLRIATSLSLADPQKMATLIHVFENYFKFDEIDKDLPAHVTSMFSLMNILFANIHCTVNGDRFKDYLISEGYVESMIGYLVKNAPVSDTILVKHDDWKVFVAKPCLKHVLSFLQGLCKGHDSSMMMVAERAILIIHAIEQLVLRPDIATTAENLSEVLKQNPSIAKMIDDARKKARKEKKRIAMESRMKKTAQLGFKLTEKGQLFAEEKLLKVFEGQVETEKGLTCSICLEGYQCKPGNVLGVYTYTKKCDVESFEKEPRTIGYFSVTHFNPIHFECHKNAVRNSRVRDEWASATMHNASTRCNSLMPFWGPDVDVNVFQTCFARYQAHVNEAVGIRVFSGSSPYIVTIHDLKLLLLGFAREASFSEDSGGGGKQSNFYLVAPMAHLALYAITNLGHVERNTSKVMTHFIEQPTSDWISSSFISDGPYFGTIMTLLLKPPEFWATHRFDILQRLIVCDICRSLPADKQNAEELRQFDVGNNFATYRTALHFFFLVDQLYANMFKNVKTDNWPADLAQFIRANSKTMCDSADKILEFFDGDILVCASFDEFCDAADLMRGKNAISDPAGFLSKCIQLQSLSQ